MDSLWFGLNCPGCCCWFGLWKRLTHLRGDVGLGAGVRVQARDGGLEAGGGGAAAPQLLLGARVQLKAVLQHGQFLKERCLSRFCSILSCYVLCDAS